MTGGLCVRRTRVPPGGRRRCATYRRPDTHSCPGAEPIDAPGYQRTEDPDESPSTGSRARDRGPRDRFLAGTTSPHTSSRPGRTHRDRAPGQGRSLIKDRNVAMLTLIDPQGRGREPADGHPGRRARQRPVVHRGGVVGPRDDIRQDPRVDVSCSSSDPSVSVAGTAEGVDDSAKPKDLWDTFTDAWIQGGPENPERPDPGLGGHRGVLDPPAARSPRARTCSGPRSPASATRATTGPST